MLAAGLPAGPVLNVDEAIAADHTEHRNMVTEIGPYRGLGTPIKLSRTPGGTRSAPPRFQRTWRGGAPRAWLLGSGSRGPSTREGAGREAPQIVILRSPV